MTRADLFTASEEIIGNILRGALPADAAVYPEYARLIERVIPGSN